MTIKDIKEEARKKLALNIHQAIVIYLVEFTVFITLIALVVMSCVSLGATTPAAIVMICYGILLGLIAIVGSGMINFAMCDFYLATYRCKPYNIRRLGDTLARSGATKILLISLKRTLLAFLLLLCLIVPGVIYLVRTSMANYLLIANPKMSASTALSASNKVMSGKTGAYFALCMSLVGWYLLGLITLGLGYVFIIPYTNLIKATYYKRNLQGDKTVYQITVQPVSVVQGMPPQQNYVPANEQPKQQAVTAQPVAAEAVGSPIDTLADEDVIDMNAAMHDFDAPQDQIAEVKEVPISPVTQNRRSNEGVAAVPEFEPVLQPEPADEREAAGSAIAPDVKTENEKAPEAHDSDGSNIIETERILTTREIDESNALRKQAIDSIYSRSDSKKPNINYFAGTGNQNPDDFFVAEDDFETPSDVESASNVIAPVHEDTSVVQADEPPVISDSELDEFLRGFDDAAAQSEDKPLKRDVNANTNRDGVPPRASDGERRSPHDRHAATERVASDRHVVRRSPDGNGDAGNDRTERIRREREERLNLNNKK